MQAQPDLTPLGRRCLWLAGVLAVLLIAVVVNYVAHGGTGGLNPVAEAAERTARMPGGRIAMEVKYSASTGAAPVVGNGDGVFDTKTNRTDLNLTIPLPGAQSQWVEVVTTPRKIFIRGSGLEGELPPKKLWLAMEPLLGASGKTAVFGSNDSASGMLAELGAVGGGVDREGKETVRGDLTTHYKSEIDPSKVVGVLKEKGDEQLAQAYEILAEKAPQPIGIEVWVDRQGLIRQITEIQQLPITAGVELTSEVRMQFYDFGPHPSIRPPKRHQVFDYTPILRAELGLEDGSALGPLTPPAGAKPLSVGQFHKQAITICRRVVGEGEVLTRRSRPLTEAMKGLGLGQEEEGTRLLRKFGQKLANPAVRLIRRGTLELARLDPPASLADDFHRYLVMDAKQTEWNQAQTRVYELGKAKLPSLADREGEEPQEKAERKELASQLGLSACEKEPKSEGQAAESTLE